MSKNQKLRQVYAEDINRAVLAAMTSLQDSNVIDSNDVPDGEAYDELAEALASVLEEYFDYPDYRNYN